VAWLSSVAPSGGCPDRVVFREALPRTGTGKFSKRELRKIYAGYLFILVLESQSGMQPILRDGHFVTSSDS